jgi:hypothetical protein
MHAEAVAQVFSIFHDGSVVGCQRIGDDLNLDIEIEYLAQRVAPEYGGFSVSILGARDFSFTTWPKHAEQPAAIFSDPMEIFGSEPEILSSKIKDGFIEIALNESSRNVDYSGGILRFKADGIRVLDEGGYECGVETLGKICQEYWDEWARRHKKDGI